ncbi:hypothetical protein WM21_22685 [Burkholderia ubonensis]|nr:hypothetical protein WM21_22685 [Burkholderia ubonensis]
MIDQAQAAVDPERATGRRLDRRLLFLWLLLVLLPLSGRPGRFRLRSRHFYGLGLHLDPSRFRIADRYQLQTRLLEGEIRIRNFRHEFCARQDLQKRLVCIRQLLRACPALGDERRKIRAGKDFEMEQRPIRYRRGELCFPVALVLPEMRDNVSRLDGVRLLEHDHLIDGAGLRNRLQLRKKHVAVLQLHIRWLTYNWAHRIAFNNLRDLYPPLAATVIGVPLILMRFSGVDRSM